jgi:outer membrane lipoprotein carrier protein
MVKSKVCLAFAVIIGLAASFVLLPDVEVSAQQSSVSAKQLTRLLEEHYRHLKTLRAVFLERYNEGPKQLRVESGTAYFRRPGQMRWEYESPEKKLFLTDGKIVWFYVPYDHTVTKAPTKESTDWRTPLALLTGKADLSRLCRVVDLVDQRGLPPGHSVLRCLPKGEQKATPEAQDRASNATPDLETGEEFTEVLLEVDSSSGELARIEIRQPGGVDLEYRFGNWQTDIPLPEDLFHFQVPPGVAIVDEAGATTPTR